MKRIRGLATSYGVLVAFLAGALAGIPWATLLLTGLLPAASFGGVAALYWVSLTRASALRG